MRLVTTGGPIGVALVLATAAAGLTAPSTAATCPPSQSCLDSAPAGFRELGSFTESEVGRIVDCVANDNCGTFRDDGVKSRRWVAPEVTEGATATPTLGPIAYGCVTGTMAGIQITSENSTDALRLESFAPLPGFQRGFTVKNRWVKEGALGLLSDMGFAAPTADVQIFLDKGEVEVTAGHKGAVELVPYEYTLRGTLAVELSADGLNFKVLIPQAEQRVPVMEKTGFRRADVRGYDGGLMTLQEGRTICGW